MVVSVTEPIGRALTRTGQVLFKPFDLVKWLKLGFCAFLAHLGNSSGGGSGGNVGPLREQADARGMERAGDWVRENWELVVALGAVILLVFLAIAVLVLWLQARGRFMFLDGVVRNRGAVVEPWSTYRAEANSTFWFRVCVGLLGLLAALVIAGIGLGIAWVDIDAERVGGATWGGIIVGGGLLLMLALTMALIDMFLTDFVVPAMYARRIGVMDGWGVVRREVFDEHAGAVFLYVLMKILIAVATGMLVMSLVCMTLCVAACCLSLPYVGTVLILPLLVFGRCYSLCFLDQLGGPWELMSRDEPGQEPG